MHLFRSLRYATRRGVREVSASMRSSLAIACAIGASLIAAGVIRLADHNLAAASAAGQPSPQLVVYLAPGIDIDRANRIATALELIQGTTSVVVIDADQAHSRLEMSLADDSELVHGLADVTLPISIEVGLKPGLRVAASMHLFVDKLTDITGVESVETLGTWTERGPQLVAALQAATQWLLLLLIGCALFVAVVIMRVGSAQPAPAQALYRQLGASLSVTSIPLLVAGAIRGGLGALLALVALFSFYSLAAANLSPIFAVSLNGAPLVFLPASDMAALLGGGVVIGSVAAAIANRSRR